MTSLEEIPDYLELFKFIKNFYNFFIIAKLPFNQPDYVIRNKEFSKELLTKHFSLNIED